MQEQYKVSAAILLASILVTGLLVREPAAAPSMLAQNVDAGLCHGPRQELRFAWLKPGEEPTVSPAAQPSICLAVYQVHRGQR